MQGIRSKRVAFSELHTFNKIEAMNKPQQKQLARWTREKFSIAWQEVGSKVAAADHFSDVLGDPPYIFVFNSYIVSLKVTRAPDADAFSVMAKRCLDGAVDAGVLPDDGEEYISKACCTLPVLASPGGMYVKLAHANEAVLHEGIIIGETLGEIC